MKLTAAVLAVFVCGSLADWIDFGMDGIDHATLTVIESTPSGMVLEVLIPGISIVPATENGIDFSILNIPGTTITALEPGYPQFPKVSFLAALPSNPSVTCTVEFMRPVEVGTVTPYPMQPILPEDGTVRSSFIWEPSAYEDAYYPIEMVQYKVDGVLRGVTVGNFAVNPVMWDAGTGEMSVSVHMRVRIDFGGAVTVDRRLYSRFFEPVFRQTLINADILGEPDRTESIRSSSPVYARTPGEARDIDAADLLIMAGDDFVDTFIEDFVTAKYEQGYLTAVVTAGSWSQTEIKDYIQTAYDTWTVPPSFLLTIGDSDQLIPYNSSGIWSDNRYACVDGGPDDYFADIFHGRFATPTEYYFNVQQKQLKWQFDPLMDVDFWNNVLCAGALETGGDNTANRWFLFTCETVHDTYEDLFGKTAHREYMEDSSVNPPYYYRSDLPSAGQEIPMEIEYTGSTAGIVDVINDGVFMIQHRSHGSVTGWVTPPFQNSDLALLTNGEETPAVFSFNCSTGLFYGGTCFAESMARMEGGAVMVVAACGTSYSYFNDYVIYGCHMSFNDTLVSPPFSYTNPSGGYLAGQMMTDGKMEMQVSAPFNPYGSWEGYAEDTWDLFLVFGDPTMDMRTMVPFPLDVDAPQTLPEGSTQAVFTVSAAGTGVIPGALVCLRKEEESLYATGLTDSSGVVTLTFDPIGSVQNILWMVTAHNALPEEGCINDVGIADQGSLPEIVVGTPFPNPGNSIILFPVTLDSAGAFELTIYDISGRAVATVHSGELEAGSHELLWDGTCSGGAVPSGMYMARYTAEGGETGIHKIVLVK